MQNRPGLLSDIKGANQVHPQDAFKFLGRHFFDGAVTNDTRVIDENVQTAALVADLHHHRFNLRGITNVAFDDERIGQRLCDVFSVRFVFALRVGNIIDHTLRAALPKRFDCCGADTARAAGHQHHFAAKIQRIFHL